VEQLLVEIGLGEYLAQIVGGIPMSQGEVVRPADLGLAQAAVAACMTGPLDGLLTGNAERRARLAVLLAGEPDLVCGDGNLDEPLGSIRSEIRSFADSEIAPHAQAWHLSNSLIPLGLIAEMAELGVFGLAIPEVHGGMGLGKEAMCIVAEELSRGYLGVGSLSTRSEIAAELILTAGTDEQKRKWLPRIATGGVLPTAVFTEPDAGSDLAALKTRAVRHGDRYR